jgi:organic radical activating enzyme
MLENGRPDECYYCWNIEDLEGDHFSDRTFHNSSMWLDLKKEINEITSNPWNKNYNPHYLELSFSNACSFKCGYCCPQSSTIWVDEIKKHGNYDLTYNQYGIEFLSNKGGYYPDEEKNPYIAAFWKWWPDLRKDLKVLRLTGGEAMIHTSTLKLLDLLDKEPAPQLELMMNSNMGVANTRVARITSAVADLIEQGKVKKFKMFTSIDSWGPQAEYMRQGLNCTLWEKNIDTYLQTVPNSEISFMITYNILSVAYFRPLLEKILELRQKYNRPDIHAQRINFDTPYLKEPPHWMINLLPKDEFGSYLDSDLKFIEDNLGNENITKNGFAPHEYEKFKRVRDYYYQGGPRVTPELIRQGQRDFYVFFTEFDKRNNLNLLQTFPIYEDFYNHCKSVYEGYDK